jgi:hypothetical protein
MKEDLCPYCGEKMVEKIEAATKLKWLRGLEWFAKSVV